MAEEFKFVSNEAKNLEDELRKLNKETEKLMEDTYKDLRSLKNYAGGWIINKTYEISEGFNKYLKGIAEGARDFFSKLEEYINELEEKNEKHKKKLENHKW